MRIRDSPHTLRTSVAQKSVACIRHNGLPGCAHRCPKRPLRASVSEMTPACIRFQVIKNQHLDPNIRNFTPVAESIFHNSKREFKNGHISRFCSVFQVIQVISSGKFSSAEEVDLSFNSETKEHSQSSNPSFWKRDHENVFLQMF